MANRREQQKQQRRTAILRAASLLFVARGYAATSVQDISQRARLAVGTLYHYFPSKPEIVLALVERDVEDALAAGEAVIKRPPRHPVAAVTKLIDLGFAPFGRHDRRLWRELVGAAMGDPEIGASFFASDLRLLAQLVSLLRVLEARGDLRPGLDAGRAAVVLYAVFFTWFMAYVSNEAISLDAARGEARGGVEFAMNGFFEQPPRRRRQ